MALKSITFASIILLPISSFLIAIIPPFERGLRTTRMSSLGCSPESRGYGLPGQPRTAEEATGRQLKLPHVVGVIHTRRLRQLPCTTTDTRPTASVDATSSAPGTWRIEGGVSSAAWHVKPPLVGSAEVLPLRAPQVRRLFRTPQATRHRKE